MTQKLRLEPWAITNGIIKRRRKSAVVTKADFACPLLKDEALQSFLKIARGASWQLHKPQKDPKQCLGSPQAPIRRSSSCLTRRS